MDLLHVVSFTLSCRRAIDDALAHLRRLSARSDALRCPVLLFCDLPDAACLKNPDEDPLIRRLHAGVMAMNARRPDSFFLLVRRRVWDDAARQYLGAGQRLSARAATAQLLERGQTQASFEAASISPASMKKRWPAVLFSDISMLCTPDVPARMSAYLQSSALSAVGAQVLPHVSYPQSLLARLCAFSPFSLCAPEAARLYALLQKDQTACDQPVLYTLQALRRIDDIQAVPAVPGCCFVRRFSPDVRSVMRDYSRLCSAQPLRAACLPLLQLSLLCAAAASGFSPLAIAALLPELWALVHPRAWPGVLLRTALLPLTALHALDALLCRALARSPLFRLRVPKAVLSPFACLFAACALLPAAILSVHSLLVLLPVLLLWLAAPLFCAALDRPIVERIPLNSRQLARLRAAAVSAYLDAAHDASAPPALRMLIACAACMLGLQEPDEAARQIQSLLPGLSAPTPHEQAAVLASAQYLREQMHACDAALRDLPAQLETFFLSAAEAPFAGALGALLHAAKAEQAPDFTGTSSSVPLEQLFLPLRSPAAAQRQPLSLPLTHPHTYLSLSGESAAPKDHAAERFLFLAAAAMDHPFYSLLLRSPVTGAYAAISG